MHGNFPPPDTQRDTVVDRFAQKVRDRADEAALWSNDGDAWQSIDWATYGRQVRAFAGALAASGCEPDDCIAICSYNRPEWVVAHVGGMTAGTVPVGIYHTNAPGEIAYVASHAEVRLLVLEDREQWDKIDAVRDELPDLERIVMFEDADAVDDALVVAFDAFLDEGSGREEVVRERFDAIERDDIGTMVYTSGTTGKPKGVMLSHDNLAFTAAGAQTIVADVEGPERLVSYLPLSHTAEQLFTIHLAVTFGYPVWFADDVYALRDALQAARPTFFFGVPRVWEKLKSRLESRFDETEGLRRRLVDWCRDVGREAGRQKIRHGEISGWLAVKYAIADRLFFSRIKEALGFEDLRLAISAAAPVGREVLEFFLSCDIPIREVYGQSEDCGPTTVNFPEPGKTKLGSVGLPFPGVEVRIDEDGPYEGREEGEILVRGDNVFEGYYKDPEATDEVLEDGWLRSGDVGRFDDEGFLYITGRKKAIIITAGGKNIAPQKIEQALEGIDGIGDAVAIGDERKFISALMTLDHDRIEALAADHGWPAEPEALVEHADFRAYLDREVEAVNRDLARVATVKQYTLLPEEWSQATGELTPTQKVKRRVVEEKYADEIEAMYSEG